MKFSLFPQMINQNEAVLLCPLPVIFCLSEGDPDSKEEVKNILCFYCSERMCERSYKGKNVAVLCPMSLMVQGVGMKTNLSANKCNGFLYYPHKNLLLVLSLQPCRMIVCLSVWWTAMLLLE